MAIRRGAAVWDRPAMGRRCDAWGGDVAVDWRPMAHEPTAPDQLLPADMARRAEEIGVRKATLDATSLFTLAVLAGAFIALGGVFSTTAVAGTAGAPWGPTRVLGGVTFSLGLVLVIVGGAELFTGNNLIAMAWAGGHVRTGELLWHWALVCLANLVGAAGLALLVWLSGHTAMNGGAVARAAVAIADAKAALPWQEAFFRGVLCNVLVCMAVWMGFAGRSVVDKAVAIVFPITAFVAAGFEHSIANMYFFPLALLLKWHGLPLPPAGDAITVAGMFGNLVPVIAGNVFGGSVLVALVYWVIYLRGRAVQPGALPDGGRKGA